MLSLSDNSHLQALTLRQQSPPSSHSQTAVTSMLSLSDSSNLHALTLHHIPKVDITSFVYTLDGNGGRYVYVTLASFGSSVLQRTSGHRVIAHGAKGSPHVLAGDQATGQTLYEVLPKLLVLEEN